MQNHVVLFGRPLSMDAPITNALKIVGVLDGYISGAAYTGTLDVLYQIGKAKVSVVSSTLPGGASVRMDNVAKQVVVAWPTATVTPETVHPVANGGFDTSLDWDFGDGWSQFSGYGKEGNTAARFLNYTGTSISIGTPVPYSGKRPINLGCWVQQGANSKRKAGAQCFLRWYDKDGKVLKDDYSELVDSGKGGNWEETRVSASGPAGAVSVSPCISAFRKSKNKEVWVDSVDWDHKYAVGAADDDQYSLSIKVTDAANQVAYWSGNVSEFTEYVTTGLYPVVTSDSIEVGNLALDARIYTGKVSTEEGVGITMGLASGSLTATVRYVNYTAPYENINTKSSFVSGALSAVIRYVSLDNEPDLMNVSSVLVSGSLPVERRFVGYSMAPESVNVTLSLRSGTLA